MSLPSKIAFVDVETTGCRYSDRIIDIGILRIENGKLVKTFNSLVNPGCSVPQEILEMTGVSSSQLENAPSFYRIKNEVKEMLEDCLFVAHNVRFDHSFVKNELKREEISFSPKQLCTVKLSRSLFPEFRHHNLDCLIERFGFICQNRHRAFDDAEILWKFYQLVLGKYSEEELIPIFNKLMKKPSIPINISEDILNSLPESPGVYIFYGKSQMPLYVGKSINIKDRVLSHFASDHLSSKEMKIAQQVENIETIITSGELGALFKESTLVKDLQPLYNRQLRNSHQMLVLIQDKNSDGYLTIRQDFLENIDISDLEKVVAIVKSKKSAKSMLSSLAKEYNLCQKLLGIESTKSACFGYRLSKCSGGCIKKELPAKYNLRFIEAFQKTKLRIWPFDKPIVIKESDGQNEDGYIIDKWCYIGTMNSRHENETIEKTYNFDVDTYRIVNTFLKSKNNLKKIHSLSEFR